MKQAMYLGGAALLAIFSFGFTTPDPRWDAMPEGGLPADGMMCAVLTGTLTGTLTSTLTMTCDGAANFDWSAIPSALVPADTTFLALGIVSQEELVLNLNKAIVNPVNSEPAALLSLTIESAQGLPAGVTADYPTNPLLAMSQSCVPLTGVPTEEGLFELVLSCSAQVFAGSQLEVVEDVVFSHWIQVGQGTGIEDQTLNAPAITLFPNPASDRLTLGVPANTCLEMAEVFNLAGQRVHVEAFSEEQGSQAVDVSALPQGTYLMFVHFSDHTRVAKFMVER